MTIQMTSITRAECAAEKKLQQITVLMYVVSYGTKWMWHSR